MLISSEGLALAFAVALVAWWIFLRKKDPPPNVISDYKKEVEGSLKKFEIGPVESKVGENSNMDGICSSQRIQRENCHWYKTHMQNSLLERKENNSDIPIPLLWIKSHSF